MNKRVTAFYLIFLLSINSVIANWQEKADSLENLIERAESETERGWLLLDLGNEILSNLPDNSFKHFIKAREIGEISGDTALIVRCIIGICDVHSIRSNFKLAIKFGYEALNLSSKDHNLLTYCHNRLAGIYLNMEDFENAVHHTRISLKYNELLNDSAGIAVDLHNIGLYYLENDFFDSALYYYFKSLDYELALDAPIDSYNYSNIGHTYSYMGEYDSALKFLFYALTIDSIDDLKYELSIDEYYIAFANVQKKDYDQALKYAQLSIQHARELNLVEIQLINYELLYEIYSEIDNYKQALKYALLSKDFADSMRVINYESLIQNIEKQYKAEQQVKLLNAAEKENTLLMRQKTLLICLCIVTSLLLISTIVIIILKQKEHIANQILLKELEKANYSKERLISIISHDLRGSIGTLRNYLEVIISESYDLKTLNNLIRKFYPVVNSSYDLLENLLTWAHYNKKNLIPKPELTSIFSIVDKTINQIKHMSDSKEITIVNKVYDKMVLVDENMLSVVVRNLISNAIKFSATNTKVLIESELTPSFVEITITDQGVGIDEKIVNDIFITPEKYHTKGTMGEGGSGLGLLLCRSFIEKHDGKIWVESTKDVGSKFYFTIPLNE